MEKKEKKKENWRSARGMLTKYLTDNFSFQTTTHAGLQTGSPKSINQATSISATIYIRRLTRP